MDDRILLELAAKAAGLLIDGWHRDGGLAVWSGSAWINWNPRDDDGDALRLAVKLRITPYMRSGGCDASDTGKGMAYERWRDDPYAATRRAIVRAAAEIGKAMP